MHRKSRSSTTTEPRPASRPRGSRAERLPPVHPGEVLLEEFLKPMNITQYRLAKDISVPPRRVNEIVLQKRAITADTALRFGRYFGTSEQFWLNLQTEYDLDVERDRLGDRLSSEVRDEGMASGHPSSSEVRGGFSVPTLMHSGGSGSQCERETGIEPAS
jgi:addiction module HigA family antidote